MNAQEPLSGETLLLEDQGNKTVRDAVITHSRKCYAIRQEHADENKNLCNTTKKGAVKNKGIINREPMIDEI